MSKESILIAFEVDNKGAIRKLRQVNDEVEKVPASTKKASVGISGFTAALAGATAVVYAASKAVGVFSGAVRAAGVTPATLTVNGNNFVVLSFADGQEQEVQANVKIPDDIDDSVDAYVCLGWSSPTVSQDCDWVVTYLVSALNESTDQAGTPLQDYVASSATGDGLVISLFTIPAAGINATDVCIHLTIMRDGNDGSDNLGAVAELHGLALRYTPK